MSRRDGWPGELNAIDGGPQPGPAASTEFSTVSNSGRRCVCGQRIPGTRAKDAVYCSFQCREKQSRIRRNQREAVRFNCRVCSVVVPAGRQYCDPCRLQRRLERSRSYYAKKQRMAIEKPLPLRRASDVASGTVGAIAELLVAADLLSRGYHVFRAMSPACPCDLLVMKDNLSARVEVRRVTRNMAGDLPTGCTAAERGRFDVLARVEPDGVIHYRGLEELKSSG